MKEKNGFRFFHLVYSANTHDSRLFPTAMSELCQRFEEMCRNVKGAILVMDKGNNSAEKIRLALQKKMTIVGSLVPSQNLDLVKRNLKSFKESYNGCPVYREKRDVFGVPGVVAVSFNEKLRKRQVLRLEEKLKKTESNLSEVMVPSKKKNSKVALEKQLKNILKESGLGA
ncbi:MAG: hypothetical protein HQM08_19435 [Candidatus Riflebacteria bacterium]|nr:hypothetical protein [Candidatus Riflebacteria bacterium]